ncbi:MAG TPA: SDR family oxidoreductase [Solirubrobacterales bacterium]|nr:SDR family oxidoreductase [Solirubrobacterales bacterium]
MTEGQVQQRLGGATILLTGGSGFLGKAVLSALLTHAAGFERLILLLRADDDAAAQRRLTEEVLTNEAFAALPEGWLRDRLATGRIYAVAGDLASEEPAGPQRSGWGEVDVLINCAASVSFEEPLDDALTLNAFGPARLVKGLRDAGSDPYVVHVSTAYAADCHVEVVHEDGLPHPAVAGLDPQAMLAEARMWRGAVEAESRLPAELKHFARLARHDAARKPGLDVEARAEELRDRWVRLKLSEQGRRWASEAGWPDTYALTKALGERELIGQTERITIVRPSIIESSLAQPHPGWLEGIKVADPLILAYAAGGLTHLAGRATNLIDIVPVDCVANACVLAASNPAEGGVRALAISSTARNPLRIGELAGHIKAHFRREPFQRGSGAPVRIGDLEFVDRKVAVGSTARRERLARLAARAAAGPLPAGTKGRLRKNAALAGQMTRMVKIYAPYTELDCVFDDANACALAASLSDADRAALPFDTAAIDWTQYLEYVHLPEVHRMATA